MSKARGGLYLIRCDKPDALIGLSYKWSAAGALVLMSMLHFVQHHGWLVSVLISLPVLLMSGRHNAYVGMTSSYYHRERQHLFGSTVWGTGAQPFADLKPRFYRILPLGEFLTKEQLIGRRLMQLMETVAIGLLIPVYNTKQQAPWNMRRINKHKADAQRIKRMKYGWKYRAGKTLVRYGLMLIVIGGAGWTLWQARR